MSFVKKDLIHPDSGELINFVENTETGEVAPFQHDVSEEELSHFPFLWPLFEKYPSVEEAFADDNLV